MAKYASWQTPEFRAGLQDFSSRLLGLAQRQVLPAGQTRGSLMAAALPEALKASREATLREQKRKEYELKMAEARRASEKRKAETDLIAKMPPQFQDVARVTGVKPFVESAMSYLSPQYNVALQRKLEEGKPRTISPGQTLIQRPASQDSVSPWQYLFGGRAPSVTPTDGSAVPSVPSTDGGYVTQFTGPPAVPSTVVNVNPLAKPTVATTEKKILEAGDIVTLLDRQSKLYEPGFHTLGEKFKHRWTKISEKLGGVPFLGKLVEPSEEDKIALGKFSRYTATTGQLFTQILKALSGVAVNPTEYKRAEIFIPNVGTTIWGGDSPSEVQAKRAEMMRFSRNAMYKYHYIRKNGLSLYGPNKAAIMNGTMEDDVSVFNMENIINRRGAELRQQYETEGLKEWEIRQSITRDLIAEFGPGMKVQ